MLGVQRLLAHGHRGRRRGRRRTRELQLEADRRAGRRQAQVVVPRQVVANGRHEGGGQARGRALAVVGRRRVRRLDHDPIGERQDELRPNRVRFRRARLHFLFSGVCFSDSDSFHLSLV